MKKEIKNTKEVIISSKKIGKKIIVNRQIVNPQRDNAEGMPENDEEWDQYFEDHQYGYGADLNRQHGIDLACSKNPMGPWFERKP